MAEEKESKTGIELAGKEFGWKEEVYEDNKDVYTPTDYPVPQKRLRLVYESFSLSMEETYFWILTHLQHYMSFNRIEKITDIFSSAENSSIFGQTSQRLGMQQDRIANTLGTVEKMVKDLFSIVRELRIIDERRVTYEAWNKKSKAADATLKQLYIDFVESQGGQTKPSSVYGLAQNLGYTTLPDFYFNTRVYSKDEIDKIVDNLPTNNNLKNVLRRKLFEFIVWKEETYKELTNRRVFTLHYLRQQWAIIKMYMGWLKPYLRNVKRLSMNEKQILGPEIISAFETAALEIEILACKDTNKADMPCILINYKYFVKPSLSYQQPESYQRGPVHVGRVDMTFRAYGWSQLEVDAYKKYRQQQEMDLLSIIDESLKASMDALSGDLERYLAEVGEEEFKKKLAEKKEAEKDTRTGLQKFLGKNPASSEQGGGFFEPFVEVFMGVGQIIGAFVPENIVMKKKDSKMTKGSADSGKAAAADMKIVWTNYKKSHGLLTW